MGLDELGHVVGLVGVQRDPPLRRPMMIDRLRAASHSALPDACVASAATARPVAVLHQDVAHVARPSVAFAVELGLGICHVRARIAQSG